jgi:hypothetical protein
MNNKSNGRSRLHGVIIQTFCEFFSKLPSKVASVSVLLASGLGVHAQFTFTTLNVPGATDTIPLGVSGSDIVGGYDNGGSRYGFVYNGSGYTTLAVPGAVSTIVQGISGGDIVGYYSNSSGTYGFLYNGSSYIRLWLVQGQQKPSPTASPAMTSWGIT